MLARDLVADWMIEEVAEVLGVDAAAIGEDVSFTELGLSSLLAVELSGRLEEWTEVVLPPTLAFDYPTIGAAAEYVATEAERAGRDLRAAGGPRR